MATHIAKNATGDILSHYQNVIEGSATLNGVPGSESNEPILRAGLTLTAASGNTTTMAPGSPSSAVVAKGWAPSGEAPYFLLCLTATNATNVNAARKISAWDGTTFTVVKAFPASVTAADTFTILQGFRRIPNGIDLNEIEDGPDAGFDRSYQLSMMPGKVHPFYGKGLRTYESELELRLRIVKHMRENDARSSVLENLRILRDAISDSDNTEATYTRALFAEDGSEEIVEDDPKKIVAKMTFRLVYRVDLTQN